MMNDEIVTNRLKANKSIDNGSVSKRRKALRGRKAKVFSAPMWSSCVYIKICSSSVHMFRFFLEAEENIGIMTVVDRWGAVLKVRFSPHQKKALLSFLDEMQESLPFTIINLEE